MIVVKILLPLLCGSFLLASSGSSLYTKKCKSCHGVTGETKSMGKSKVIKGMPVATIEKAMQDYATGKRKSMSIIKKMKKDFMRQHSKEELHAVSKYINSL
ncbi:MAG: c-type cytochrome [Sulfurovum sp.]|nr:c-type cytochrome [Sulfurovum sp.]